VYTAVIQTTLTDHINKGGILIMRKGNKTALFSSICLTVGVMIALMLAACSTPAPATKPAPAPTPAPAPAVQPVELKLAHMEPAGSFMDQHFQRWADKIKADSNGKLTFRIYPAAVLASAFDTYQAISKGVADVGASYRYGAPGSEVCTSLSTFLAGIPDSATGTRIVDEVAKKFSSSWDKEWSSNKVLWTTTAGPAMVVTKSKAVRSLEDLKGQQLRVPVKPASELLTALGGTPVGMPLADLAVALEKGTVDGCTLQGYSLKAYKVADLTKYTTKMTLYAPPDWFTVMNKDSYSKLAPELQKVIDNSMEWGKRDVIKAFDDADADGIEYAKKLGMEFITLSPQERTRWMSIIGPVQDKQAAEYDVKGYPDTEILKFIRDRIAAYVK
jgi:TRAP-type C4-dicarboxylate transport system substrate-binding protein